MTSPPMRQTAKVMSIVSITDGRRIAAGAFSSFSVQCDVFFTMETTDFLLQQSRGCRWDSFTAERSELYPFGVKKTRLKFVKHKQQIY